MLGKRLVHGDANPVQRSLEGLCSTAPHLRLLDAFPEIKVAFDAGHDPAKVAVVSGGGSGHEPAFAGYVGKGMLAAAACGDVFAAPSAEAVLAAVRSVTGPGGCLLVPLNYTGDRLNFGIAEQRAKAAGLRVESVVVDDDCAIADPGVVGRRGLAGAVLVVKIVGALAQSGLPLEDLAESARRVVRSLGTMGAGLDTCALPGQPPSDSRLQADEVELGLGIHGEPGVQKVKNLELSSLVDALLLHIRGYDPPFCEPGCRIGILVNNLGSMTVMDLHCIARSVLERLEKERPFEVEFVTVGTYMTSISVAGFSLTLLKLQSDDGELLRAPTEAVAWTVKHICPVQSHPKIPFTRPQEHSVATEPLREEGKLHQACLLAALHSLREKEEMLNAWDATVGDGDCGSTLVRACDAIEQDMKAYDFNSISAFLGSVAASVGRACGGTSGALYRIAFLSASLAPETEAAAREQWIEAFEKGLEGIEKYGRAKEGDRTMLDALRPAYRSLKAVAASGVSTAAALQSMQRAAEAGAAATVGMVALAGRARYVPPELFKTTPDPGAKAAAFWLRAIAETLRM